MVALLTPLHPLLLWHYIEYAHVIEDQKSLLEPRDRALVRTEFRAGGVPLFFASLGVPRLVSETAPTSLPFSGKFGGLPHFSERADARDPNDGFAPSGGLPRHSSALQPSAPRVYASRSSSRRMRGRSCRCAATSPIRIVCVAHTSPCLRRSYTVGAELNLSADEERRVQQRFGDHVDRRFTFESRRVGPLPTSPPDGAHAPHLRRLRSDRATSADAGAALQKIQPLANRRRLRYSISEPQP